MWGWMDIFYVWIGLDGLGGVGMEFFVGRWGCVKVGGYFLWVDAKSSLEQFYNLKK